MPSIIKSTLAPSSLINWELYDHLLGQKIDDDIAKIIGCSNSAVRHRRKKLNIDNFMTQSGKRQFINSICWDQYDNLLGTMTDLKLSKIIQCTEFLVKKRRYLLSIPAYTRPVKDQSLLKQSQMKCNYCYKIKSINDFGLNSRRCKFCLKQNRKTKRDDHKSQCIAALGGKCQNCGFNKYQSSLQFHHVNSDKEGTIATMLGLKKYQNAILKELDKCCLLCSNCHDAFHFGDISLQFIKTTFGWKII